MQQQLFTHNGWDGDHEMTTYYNPVLIVPIGDFPVGTAFMDATILWEKGMLQFTKPNGTFYEYSLKLQVVQLEAYAPAPEELPKEIQATVSQAVRDNLLEAVNEFADSMIALAEEDNFEQIFGTRDFNFDIGSLTTEQLQNIYDDNIRGQ